MVLDNCSCIVLMSYIHVGINARRATPSGAFSVATPSLQLNKSGLGPFFRPTALKLAHLEQPNVAHLALLDEKMADSSDIQISVNWP